MYIKTCLSLVNGSSDQDASQVPVFQVCFQEIKVISEIQINSGKLGVSLG